MIGLFPLFVGGFAFYVIKMTEIIQMQKLINKGMSPEEAERRTTSKKFK
jgi:hypothetical protein